MNESPKWANILPHSLIKCLQPGPEASVRKVPLGVLCIAMFCSFLTALEEVGYSKRALK